MAASKPLEQRMLITDAQREVRSIFDGGSYGQFVSSVIWLLSAALATWSTSRSAIVMLVVGGFFIFPLTTLLLRIRCKPTALSAANPFRYLAMQTAFVLPFSMPLVVPAVAYRATLFYPAMMILVGAHYLPFGTLYGMRSFFALSAILITGGVTLALYFPSTFTAGGWVTGAVLLLFAVVGHVEAKWAA
jgi:hypothetical protein